MKQFLIFVAIIAIAGCATTPKMTEQECKAAGGLMYWGDCETDKESDLYKWALEKQQKEKAKCVSALDTWTYITDINAKDAVVMTKYGYDTWIIENAGNGYAHGRTYGIEQDSKYCYAATGYINALHHYPIAKKVKWKK